MLLLLLPLLLLLNNCRGGFCCCCCCCCFCCCWLLLLLAAAAAAAAVVAVAVASAAVAAADAAVAACSTQENFNAPGAAFAGPRHLLTPRGPQHEHTPQTPETRMSILQLAAAADVAHAWMMRRRHLQLEVGHCCNCNWQRLRRRQLQLAAGAKTPMPRVPMLSVEQQLDPASSHPPPLVSLPVPPLVQIPLGHRLNLHLLSEPVAQPPHRSNPRPPRYHRSTPTSLPSLDQAAALGCSPAPQRWGPQVRLPALLPQPHSDMDLQHSELPTHLRAPAVGAAAHGSAALVATAFYSAMLGADATPPHSDMDLHSELLKQPHRCHGRCRSSWRHAAVGH